VAVNDAQIGRRKMSTLAPEDPAGVVRFVLDGELVTVRDLPATTTVLEYLREVAGRTGTKEGCAEGDCGACTVVLGELTADGQSVSYNAVNSCIRFLPTIDGKELVTVESLQSPEGELHPVQRSMVEHHGSQCGFCTPGFVMSLFALYLRDVQPAREAVLDAISGNLCRCTGYRPIIDAGCHMSGYAETARWNPVEAQSASRVKALQALSRKSDADSLRFSGFYAPLTVDDLATTLEAAPDSLVLAGGTDVGLWVTKHLRELPPIVYVGGIEELRQIQRSADGLHIGAAATLTDAWAALMTEFPALTEVAKRFASPPVCNSGTLGGNIANGSPIGDSMPALIALGAQLHLRHGARVRSMPLESFYRGYQKKDIAAGEFVVGVTVPSAIPGRLLASYKIAKRTEQDISAVCGAFAVDVRDDHIDNARFAYGGMAAIPARALHAETAVIGMRWSEAAFDRAAEALSADFKPLTDARATAGYRLQTAGNMLRRFYMQNATTNGPGAFPVRVTDI
jgi:xanthine dehydrogenase small subunit